MKFWDSLQFSFGFRLKRHRTIEPKCEKSNVAAAHLHFFGVNYFSVKTYIGGLANIYFEKELKVKHPSENVFLY